MERSSYVTDIRGLLLFVHLLNSFILQSAFRTQETFAQVPALKARAHQLLHYLYNIEILSEDAIISWYENLDDDSGCKTEAIAKFIEWLEEDDEDSDED